MKGPNTFVVSIVTAGLIAIGQPWLAIARVSQTAPQPQPAEEQVTPDPWPKSAQVNGATYTLYQPQLESWDGYNLEGHAAVSVRPAGTKSDTFGAIVFTAVTLVDKETRTVRFQNIKIDKANFPSAPDKAAQYQKDIQSLAANGPAAIPLDRLQAALGVLQAQQKGQSVPVNNQPPNLIFSQTAAVLVLIDGDPKWSDVPSTQFARAINTRALLLRDQSRKLYVHLFDGFMTADDLSGPWTVATSVPAGADSIAQQLAKENLVDLMEGPPSEKDPAKKPSLKTKAPAIYAETSPSELIVIEGKPDWVSIAGTNLLYVNNTTADIVKDLDNQQTYVLVGGRWFSGSGFSGPWQYVAGSSLPPDFAKIPDDSPKENMKASIPGTAQAQEAVIATQIPQTATVNRSTTRFTPRISGAPELKPIEGTPLSYVFNSADPIIQVPAGSQTAASDGGGGNGADQAAQWYAVHDGVWFNAGTLTGPWAVATSIPPVIYSIPPSSPVYYVTYVKVYASTPQEAVDGYTPGYLGTVVSSDGTAVYGTGYQYPAYYSDSDYYPAPATYGYGTELTWTPWLGWAYGFGMGWLWGADDAGWGDFWGWGCAPYWGGYAGLYGAAFGPRGGAAVWGPGGWAGTTGNVYRHFGSTGVVGRASGGFNAWTGNAWSRQVGRSYNSTTGRISAGHRSSVQNVYTGNSISHARGGTYNPTTGTGARGGRTTFTNPSTGKSGTIGHGTVAGPGGQTHFANVNGNFYADHNGNVYKGNAADGFQRMGDNGQWSPVQDRNQLQSLQSHDWSRQFGNARSAASSWGGNWSGFNRGGFGGDRFGGGGWGGGRFGGGGFGDRFGGGFGGFRGGFGGGGFRGGGRRR